MKYTLLCLLLFAWGCRQQKSPAEPPIKEITSVRGIGKIIPENEILKLALQTSGTVASVFAHENDSLTSGSTILCLTDQSEMNEVALAQAAITSQRAQIAATKAQVTEEKAKEANLQLEYDRIARLYADGAETGQVKENAATELQVQQSTFQRAQEDLTREISKLNEAEKNLELKKTMLEKRCLKAPLSGILLELNVHPGEYVTEGITVGQFRPDGSKIAVCEIDELFADRVKVGQKAYLLSSGGMDTLATGRVFFTGEFLKKKSLFYEEAGEAEDRRVMEVKIRPDHPTSLLLNAKIECSILIDPDK